MSIVYASIGGALIGAAAVWLYLSIGRIAGISGIAAQSFKRVTSRSGEVWPLFFLVGLGLGGWVAYMGVPGIALPNASLSLEHGLILVGGGVLVGIGTRLGSGCTSGHGVCGISRFSLRSLVATLTFLGVGMVTATLISLILA